MLDDPQRRRAADPHGMLGIAGSLPEQLEEGIRLARGLDVGLEKDRRLVIFGMGGSAIAGDLALTVAQDRGYAVKVVRDTRLPPSLHPDDLLVFISYSGDTWETLSCYREALSGNHSTLAISSGGELRETALANGSPHLVIPRGLPPRGALGYLLAPLLVLLSRQLQGLDGEVEEALSFVARRREDWSPSVPIENNRAKSMALGLQDMTPIIYAPPRLRGVARRWQTEINEMAKVLCWSGEFPEADHNELVGWMEDSGVDRFSPVVLMTREESLLDLQLRETIAMMNERVHVEVVEASDVALLGQVLELVHLGDMVSIYLAIARGVDPYPVESIARLKAAVQARMAQA